MWSRLLLPLLLLSVPALAGRRRAPPVPEPPPIEQPPPGPEPWTEPLFPPTVVVDPGPVPTGLAGRDGWTCAACHPRSHGDWEGSGHARGPSAALLEASAGLVGCDVCHRPLTTQRPTLETVWDGRLDRSTSSPNSAFEPSSWLENVGCAACHVREGVVLAADPDAAARPAPHPVRYAPALADGTMCASCHQLAVPGSETPLYDTWGEFERSGFAAAGVTCLTCHGHAGAEPGFATHDPARPLAHALSIGLDLAALRLVRGADPVAATLTVRNTGAGHAVPTGSPWRRVEVRAFLEGPPDKVGHRARRAEVVEVLGRTLTEAPPFAVTTDTRLLPGASRAVALALALPADAPPAGWSLVVEVGVPGDADPRHRFERRWPLTVE